MGGLFITPIFKVSMFICQCTYMETTLFNVCRKELSRKWMLYFLFCNDFKELISLYTEH